MPAGSLEQRLSARQFAITTEITPPVAVLAEALQQHASELRGLVDAVNLTDGAGARAHMDVMAAAVLLKQSGVEPIMQLTCRDRNRIALQSLLLGSAALGICNLLILRGDDPRAGDQPDAKPVFDLDPVTLLATAVAIRDRGELPHGRPVDGRARYFLGAADMPIDPPPDWEPAALLRKLNAGAQFIQTQFCMDAEILRRYMSCLQQHGVTDRAHFLIGVAPLASARSARWIRDKLFGSIIPDAIIRRLEAASDPKAEGQQICLDLMSEYQTIPGVAGVHVMAPLNESAVPELVSEFRRRNGTKAG